MTKASYQSKFEGKKEELKNHIYNVGVDNQADLFTRTTKEIVKYAGRHFKQSLDIRTAIENLSEVVIPVPTDRGTWNLKFKKIILSKDLEIYVKILKAYAKNKSAMFSIVMG